MSDDDFELLIGTLNLWKRELTAPKSESDAKAKPVTLPTKIKFDEAMRRAMRVSPPPSGKKTKRKVWRKKRR
jgi:hypothetical protein